MKKITLKLYGSSLVDIFVEGEYKTFISHRAIRRVVNELVGKRGEVLTVPSRDGEMSLRCDDDGDYDIYDGDKNLDENLCQEEVEEAIGTGFRKKYFTFYLREV